MVEAVAKAAFPEAESIKSSLVITGVRALD